MNRSFKQSCFLISSMRIGPRNIHHHHGKLLFSIHKFRQESNFHTTIKGTNSVQTQDFSQQCLKLREEFEHQSDHHVQYAFPIEQVLSNYLESIGRLHQEFKDNKTKCTEQDEKELVECWLVLTRKLITSRNCEALSDCLESIYEIDFTKFTEIREMVFRRHSAFITLCEMMNDIERRDLEIKKLYDYYHSGRFGPIINSPRLDNIWNFPNLEGSFLRDRFTIKNCAFHLEEPQDVIVLVNEFFDLLGETVIKNVFVVYDTNFNYLYRFSIGSYQTTHNIVKEFKTMELLDNERAFHLDLYHKDGHVLFGLCQGPNEGVPLPFYDQAKQGIVNLLSGDNFDLSTCCNK